MAEKGEEAFFVMEGAKEPFDEKSESRRNSGDSNTYSNIDSTEKDIRGVIRKAIEEHHLKTSVRIYFGNCQERCRVF